MSFTSLTTYLIALFAIINIIRMVIFMIGSDIYGLIKSVREKHSVPMQKLPTFSVVIPAHNEEVSVLRAIDSVVYSNYPQDKLQIILVDDGSTDQTSALAQQYKQDYGIENLTVVKQTNAGKARALNNGLANYATGELVMCLDADSALEANALRNAAKYFKDPRVVALSSNVKIKPTGTLFNLIQVFEYLVCYQMKKAQTIFNIEYIIGGIGSTFRHSTLKQIGYYDTNTITEDIDLTMKFLQLGNKDHLVVYGDDVITYTESVLDIKGLIKQRFRWKFGRCQTFFKNKSLFFSPEEKQSKWLTWLYLPYALFSDLAFFFEPLLMGYLIYIIIHYFDWVTLVSAFTVIGIYITMNVLSEDSIKTKDKIKMAIFAPSMYLLFYILSFVEYVALIRTYAKFWKIPQSIKENHCGWQHVERRKVIV